VRLRIKRTGEGLHPSEVMIEVETTEGNESLVVDESHLIGDELNVGWPVGTKGASFLIELPSETFRGSWRVWVPRGSVVAEREVA